jgi:hypothetical protein
MADETSHQSSEGFAIQVTVDCADPHELATWWAETLRWEVEPQDEGFIRSMIEQGHASDADTRMHHGALVWREGAAVRPIGEPGHGQPRILFQLVGEPKTVKNRVHLDVRPTAVDLSALRDELVARGAAIVGRGRQGPHEWATLADPEGNEFCV